MADALFSSPFRRSKVQPPNGATELGAAADALAEQELLRLHAARVMRGDGKWLGLSDIPQRRARDTDTG